MHKNFDKIITIVLMFATYYLFCLSAYFYTIVLYNADARI